MPKNMNYQKEEIESKNIDHLGIIAGIYRWALHKCGMKDAQASS
jgi:S-ribosylhomocysteine lyase LuxS involved in autoinducer biosynthesis